MNKRHWNTVILDGSVPDGELEAMVVHSFEQVVAGLAKEARVRISRQWTRR
jgi:predicted DNA-binding protein (MmcQ/YjbR family)